MPESHHQIQIQKPVNEDPIVRALEMSKKVASTYAQYKGLNREGKQAMAGARAMEMLDAVHEAIGHHDGKISAAYSKMAGLKDSLEQQLKNGTARKLLAQLKPRLNGLSQWYEATYGAQAKQLNNLFAQARIRHRQLDQLIEQEGTLPLNRLALATLAYFYSGNPAKELFYYRELADRGDTIVQSYVGWMNSNNRVKQDFKEAVKWYRKAAEQGNADAQCNLGVLYKNGEGVKQDFKEAVNWYCKAAEQRHALAQCNLGVMYYTGQGVTQNYEEAVKWCRKAANQRHADAQCNLGWAYLTGKGVAKQNYTEALLWFFRAADQGFSRAEGDLGWMYNTGTGVDQDNEKAVEWYIRAAEHGDANAKNNLAGMYMDGLGIEQEEDRAVRLYLEAAEEGSGRAAYNLGRVYENGDGTWINVENAIKWYSKAAAVGVEGAIEKKNELLGHGSNQKKRESAEQFWERHANAAAEARRKKPPFGRKPQFGSKLLLSLTRIKGAWWHDTLAQVKWGYEVHRRKTRHKTRIEKRALK